MTDVKPSSEQAIDKENSERTNEQFAEKEKNENGKEKTNQEDAQDGKKKRKGWLKIQRVGNYRIYSLGKGKKKD